MILEKNRKIVFEYQKKASLVEEIFENELSQNEMIAKTIVSVVSTGSEIGGYMDYYGGMQYPCPTGYAGVLEVLKTGSGINNFRPGDLIFSQSPHQEYVRIKEDEAVHIPTGMKPEHAVLGRFPAVSMTTMINTKIRPTEPVIVTGLGIIGLMCAQMMQCCGYNVYAVDPLEKRRITANMCGLKNTFSSLSELSSMTGNFGLGIECSGNDNATMDLLKILRKGGELSLVGVPWRSTADIKVNQLFRDIFNSYVTIYSGWEWSLPLHDQDFQPNSNFRSFITAMEWINDGKINVEGIYEVHNPKGCCKVYDSLSKGLTEKTCVLFDWQNIDN